MRKSESGIAIVWLLGLIVVFGGLAALTIDILRVQSILRQAQNAADAAALAGARQFNGKVSGWGLAKRLTVETLRNQRIAGVSSSSLMELTFNDDDGVSDYYEKTLLEQGGDASAEPYLSSLASMGPYRVFVERGVYWQNQFSSLEGVTDESGQTLSDLARPVTYSGMVAIQVSQIPVRYNVPIHLLANAVRVRVEISGIQAFFGKFVGVSTFSAMARDSVAVSDPALTYPVAPLAVPACALFLDTDGGASLSWQYDTAEFFPNKQCIRDATFTEANPMAPFDPVEGMAAYDARAHGIFRAQSYPERSTNRSLPIYGVLGLPSSGALPEGPDETIKPRQLVEALERLATSGTSSYAISATLGDFFYPLENGVYPGGLLDNNFGFGRDASIYLREMLANDGAPFTSVFAPDSGERARNYPKLRTQDSDQDKFIKMGPDVTLRMKQFPTGDSLLPPMLNPMCADPELRELPLSERKSLDVNVMVIAPTEREPDGAPIKYCDYRAVFDGAEQDTSAPRGNTKPRVVGFVKANLFDFRLSPPYAMNTSLPNGTGENPDSANPAGVMMSGNLKTFMEKGKHFTEEHKEWRECRREAAACPRNPPFPAGCPRNCGGGPSRPNIPNGTAFQKLSSSNCFLMPTWAMLVGCIRRPSDGNFAACQNAFNMGLVSDGYQQRPEVIASGRSCLPRKIPGCTPADDNPACWVPPERMNPQYGCGGIRARLSCADARLTSPGSAAARRPTLVN